MAERFRLVEQRFRPQIDLRCEPASPAAARLEEVLGVGLPPAGASAVAGGLAVLWLGPDEWLVVAEPGSDIESRLQAAADPGTVTVVDVSAQRTTLQLTGSAAREVLAHGCALDLHPAAFPEGACASTLVARAGVVLVHRSAAEPAYWLVVRSSFAGYLTAWLRDAATEYVA